MQLQLAGRSALAGGVAGGVGGKHEMLTFSWRKCGWPQPLPLPLPTLQETSDVTGVMDGDLMPFMQVGAAGLFLWRAAILHDHWPPSARLPCALLACVVPGSDLHPMPTAQLLLRPSCPPSRPT